MHIFRLHFMWNCYFSYIMTSHERKYLHILDIQETFASVNCFLDSFNLLLVNGYAYILFLFSFTRKDFDEERAQQEKEAESNQQGSFRKNHSNSEAK